jgi:UDP-glucuronate 4-epimerase
MKILITGAAGFVGYFLTENLLKRGDTVIGLDNINDYYDVNLKYSRLENSGINRNLIDYNKFVQSEKYDNYKFIKLDLTDKENLENLVKNEKIDAICNLAAQAGVRYSLENPHAYVQSNIVGFLNVLDCCRTFNIKNFSYASSSSVYGLNENMPFSTAHNVDHPVSLYAASKKSNELMAHSYSYLYDIPTTGLRFFTVYGPLGRPDMAYFKFVDKILKNQPIDIYNNGKMKRDFTYIDDIVDGVTKVIDNPATQNAEWNATNPDPSSSVAPYKIYNIGNNSPVDLMEFINEIENALGKKAEKNLLPMQPGDVVATWADVGNLIKDFNYNPNTPLNKGIATFVEWYKEYYKSAYTIK